MPTVLKVRRCSTGRTILTFANSTQNASKPLSAIDPVIITKKFLAWIALNAFKVRLATLVLTDVTTVKVSRYVRRSPALFGSANVPLGTKWPAMSRTNVKVCLIKPLVATFSFRNNRHGLSDVDECKRRTYTCSTNEDCINELGSYSCQCKQGFEMIDGTCKSRKSPLV